MRLPVMRRPLIVFAACAAVAVGAAAAFAWWLTATDSGFRHLLQLVDRIPGLDVAATGVRGTPARGLTVATLVIDTERVRIELTDLGLRIRPLALIGGVIDAEYASVREVRVLVRPRTHPPEPSPTTFLPSWLHVFVHRLTAGGLWVSDPSALIFAAHAVTGSVAASATSVVATGLELHADGYAVTGAATLHAADPVRIDASVAISVPLTDGVMQADVVVGGNLEQMTLAASTVRPAGVQFAGAVDLREATRVAGVATVQATDLAPLLAGAPLGRIDGRLDVGFQHGDFSVRGTLGAEAVPLGRLAVDVLGRYEGDLVTVRELRIAPESGAGTVAGSGSVRTVSPHELTLDVGWQDLRWPPRARPTVVSPGGTLVLRGTPARIEYAVKAAVRGASLPPIEAEARGSATPATVEVTDGRARLLGGEIRVRGQADLGAEEDWSAVAAGRRLNPASLQARLAGRVDFDLAASGRGLKAGGDWRVALERVGGSVRGHPVSGRGAASMRHGDLAFEDFQLSIASLRVSANGQVGRDSSLALDLELGNLGDFIRDGAGSASVRGTLARSRGADSLRGEAAAHGLRVQDRRLGSLAVHADLDSARGTDSVLKLEAHDLAGDGVVIDTVTLDASGVASSHRVDLRLVAGERRASVGAGGSYEAGAEVLHVDAAEVRGPRVPVFALEHPAQLTASARSVELEHACLRAGAARLCAVGDWYTASPWSATAYAVNVPIEALPLPLPPTIAFLGTLTLSASVHGEPSLPPVGEATVDLEDVSLRYRATSGRDTLVKLGTGRIEAHAGATVLSLDGDVRSTEDSFLQFDAHVPRLPEGVAGPEPLDGRIRLRTRELNLIPVLVKDLDRMSGLLEADLSLGGTLGAPEVDGRVSLTDGELDVYLSNLLFRHVNATATFAGNGLELRGSARAGEGTLATTGNIAWHNGRPSGTLDFSGENLLVANLPEARVLASPQVSLTLAADALKVRGEVRIPTARIAPKDLSTAVRISPDQVFVDAGAPAPASTLAVDSMVRLEVGPDVRLAAYGLKGLLQGSVSVTARSGEPVTGTGELEIKDGHYVAYARELDIERGRLVLRGGPVDDAGLDIRASRKLPGYTAGVNVRGTLQAPQLSFFSDPPLPQSQIASLLIVGQTTETMQNGSAGNVLAAQGGALLVADYTHYLGIDQMTIEGDANNGTALVLGKFLTPRLYVSYGISLAEAINTLKLRYTIGDNWVLRTESGLNHSADVEYSFQR
jgi:translocation and assembly module TamB